MAKIVYAEDDRSLSESMQELLNYRGHETISAENGLEALSIIRQGGIDLLLTDGQMPKMDGLALITKLNNEKITIPVIMLSSMEPSKMPESVWQIFKNYSGKAIYLEKPADPGKILFKIDQLLNTAVVPEYGIYTNHENFCTIACEQLAKITKKEIIKETCLCKYNRPIARIAINHPCDTDECMNSITTITQENPQTQFYIVAMKKPEREQAAPLHNISYITMENAKTKFIEIVQQRPTDYILKQIKNP